jgi:phospholipid-transporting ATPase
MITPLVLVLLFGAIKDAYEDYKRYQADCAANNTIATVIRDGQKIEIKSMHIQEGDMLLLDKGEKSPVDAIIFSTSYDDGTCFIETAELDG